MVSLYEFTYLSEHCISPAYLSSCYLYGTSPQLLNYRARSISEGGDPGYTKQSNPLSAIGLLGDGEIISVADSGLDVYSCYFYDSSGLGVCSGI